MAKIFKFVPLDLYQNNKNKERPVVAVYKNGKECRFPSVRDAARLMNVPESIIVSCLKGRLKSAGGCCWKYAE